MKKFWIVGHPLSFCLCTPVMNRTFKALGIDAEFETHDIEPDDLAKVIDKVKNKELAGIVATMPYKTPSITHVDNFSEDVKAINALNLVLYENGKLHGHNTDWKGAVGALKTILPDLKDKRILILGAGGAARAAAYGFSKESAIVSIWNRTPDRAKECAAKMDIEWVPDMRKWDHEPDIIVNATSVSYQPKQSTLVPFNLWQKVELAMDAVYGKTSLFLEEAKAAKVPNIISGETWFLHQAAPMFEIITGEKAPWPLFQTLTKEAVDFIKS